jgi:hypothetical protein
MVGANTGQPQTEVIRVAIMSKVERRAVLLLTPAERKEALLVAARAWQERLQAEFLKKFTA